ncbi:hypothetical protein [Parasitella parasitica]|uniref:Uncharacterized protein n=1 Tax=Parasitella parasitica TaxID=35722 RepID=A0A0B7N7G4_9FUNG|nr:hypothetical protein [Parasitella parasitica]
MYAHGFDFMPELEQVAILRGANSITERINFGTEIERPLVRTKKTIIMCPLRYKYEPTANEGEQQNNQKRYDAKKYGGYSRL